MSVHYKFKSALDYDTVTFDGLHISIGDLKAAISQQKRIGKTSDFDLEITNAQTKEVYIDDHTLIPKNTSLLVARVPLAHQPKKQWDGNSASSSSVHKDVAPNKGLADLSRMEGSEQDKINAMISQSTFDYDPSNYQKIKGQNQRGSVPANYTCYKCQKRGHWIKDCPLANSSEPVEIRRSTGIPRSFMVPVEGPKAPGAMMTPSGTFAVPAVDREAYLASESTAGEGTTAGAAPDTAVPDELVCSLCRDLLTDAVMIPCCGNSFCDECIRGALLDSEDHECPDCREKEIAPTTLIPNRFLRNSVSSFRNQTGYSRRAPHRLPAPQAAPAEPVNHGLPPNGPGHQPGPNPERRRSVCEESDGSGDDGITVTVPPAHAHPPPHRLRHARYGPTHGLKPPGLENHPNAPLNMPRLDEQRASTPTVDERRDPQPGYGRRPPPGYVPGMPPQNRPYNNAPFRRGAGAPPFRERFPREPYQPPPPGIKDSPNGRSDDPLEAFNRMIREKEMRAKRREEERRRAQSGSRSPRSRSPRSPPPRPARSSRSPRAPRSPPRAARSPRSPPRAARSPPRPGRSSRSPRAARSPPRAARSPLRPARSSRSPPRPVRSSRSPPRPVRSSRSPLRPARSSRSPRAARSPRSPRSPRARPRSPASGRIRYSRSRSASRGRARRSPWSPRRRRSRDRSPLSLTRSPSPRRRHRSPLRYRSPLRSPPRSPPRSLPRSPPRSLPRSPPRSPLRSPHRMPLRSPPRPMSPHRFAGVYDELLSPPRRIDPPYGARFGRNNGPPPSYGPMGTKLIPPLMSNLALPPVEPPGFRGRYDGPPPFEDIPPPGIEPPVPGFEPPPFEKPSFQDRDRLPPPNYRDAYGPPRPNYPDGPGPYRDIPLNAAPIEIPVHVGEPPRFRDNYRPGALPYREGPPQQFRDGQQFRDVGPQGPYRDPNFRGPTAPFRDAPYRNIPFREPGFRETASHNAFREGGGLPFRPPSVDPRDPRDQVPTNYHDPNFRDAFRDEAALREHGRPAYRPNNIRNRVGLRRNPNGEHDRHREVHDRERYNEIRDTDKAERSRDPEKRGRDGRTRDYDRNRDYERDREREHDRATPDKKSRGGTPKRKDGRDKRRSESRGRSRDRDSRKDKKEERVRDKSSAERSKDHKEKEKKLKERKKKKREKEKEIEKKKKREKKKEKDSVKKEDEAVDDQENKINEKENDGEEKTTENHAVFDKKEALDNQLSTIKQEKTVIQCESKPPVDLYGDEAFEAVDKEIIQNYVKAEENESSSNDKNVVSAKEEPFDGIELQVNAEELDLKPELETSNKEMLAPLPELSKWEVDDENAEKSKEPGEITSPDEEEDAGKVTSDVIKRAEHAIFTKAIGSLRPIEIKKISNDRLKLYSDEGTKGSAMNNIQITVPVTDSDQRSIEINEKKKRISKTPPPRLSVKERLGGKVDDIKRGREPRVVHSTVERVKSRSKTPKKDQPYRRVTVDKESVRKQELSGRQESKLPNKQHGHSSRERKNSEKRIKDDTTSNQNAATQSHDKIVSNTSKSSVALERKKSTLDEANFEPDYDENVESENETKVDDATKKRERSVSPIGNDTKKAKIDNETIKLDLSNVKKKPETESESSSGSDDSSSSSDDARKRKKKKKRTKKKKRRAASDSDSESGSSSDEHKKKKKKRKHKKKSSKKKKKSKHK